MKLSDIENAPVVDITKFNVKQSQAEKIVENHYQNATEEPLKLIIAGQDGLGKNFVINAVRLFSADRYIVASYFGLASFNINGATFHSLLKLPVE